MRNQITMLALDLGGNLGYSRSVCTLRPELHMNVVDHGTIYLDILATDRMKKEYNEVLSRRRVRMTIYEEVIRKLTDSARFDVFCAEDVFCNPSRISAFRSLAVYMEVLERIVNNEKQKRLFTIPPKLIKKHIGYFGALDKIGVQKAILDNKAITMKNAAEATEHVFDSVACGWSFVHEFLMTLT